MAKKGTSSSPRPVNGPSTTGGKSGGGRGNNPPKKQGVIIKSELKSPSKQGRVTNFL